MSRSKGGDSGMNRPPKPSGTIIADDEVSVFYDPNPESADGIDVVPNTEKSAAALLNASAHDAIAPLQSEGIIEEERLVSPHFKDFAPFVPEGFLNYCERARTDFVRAYFAHADKGEKWKRTPEYDDARRKYRGALKEVTTSLRLANQDEKVSLFWEAEGKMLTESWRDHTRFEHYPAPVREALEDSPLAYLEDIDPSIALEFTAARDAYFNAYFTRTQKGEHPPHYEEYKKWYDTASAALAHEVHMAQMDTQEPNDSWKELVIGPLLTDEIHRLETLTTKAKSERVQKVHERAKKTPWLKRALLGFLGVATLQSADVRNDAPSQYGFEPMDDERVAPAPEVEKIKVSIPPVEASARGIHQMLKLMLEHVRAQEPEAYRVLVHPGEQPIDAARRISKETSMWIPDADLSLIVQKNRTDRIEFRDGDLVLVRATGGDTVEYVLTHGGIVVPHEWPTKEYSHYDS